MELTARLPVFSVSQQLAKFSLWERTNRPGQLAPSVSRPVAYSSDSYAPVALF